MRLDVQVVTVLVSMLGAALPASREAVACDAECEEDIAENDHLVDDGIVRAHPEESLPDLKSPLLATALSVGATATGYGLFLLGASSHGHADWQYTSLLIGISMALTGPSAGHLYTGHYGRAAAFSAARSAMFTAFLFGFAGMVNYAEAKANGHHPDDTTWLFVGGFAGIAVLTVGEMVLSYFSADSANERHRAMLSVSPFLARAPSPGGSPATGLAILGTF